MILNFPLDSFQKRKSVKAKG